MRVRQLHHPFAEVRLHDLDAEALEMRVELDLLAGHRLALGHDHALAGGHLRGGVEADLGDDLARLVRIVRDVHLAPDGAEPLGELLEELRQAFEVGLTPALDLGAAAREVEDVERGVAPPA